eukprot:6563169-Alexandrium_andersonii.AAC.1
MGKRAIRPPGTAQGATMAGPEERAGVRNTHTRTYMRSGPVRNRLEPCLALPHASRRAPPDSGQTDT